MNLRYLLKQDLGAQLVCTYVNILYYFEQNFLLLLHFELRIYGTSEFCNHIIIFFRGFYCNIFFSPILKFLSICSLKKINSVLKPHTIPYY